MLSNKILLHLRSKPIISNFSGSIHRQRTGWQQNCACQQNCILADQVQGRASSSVYLGPPCPRRVVIQRQLYRSHRRIPGEILTFTSAGNTLAFDRAIFRAQFTECSRPCFRTNLQKIFGQYGDWTYCTVERESQIRNIGF